MTEGENSDPELRVAESDPASGDPVDTIGPQIRELRQQRGLTLTKLAATTGLSVGHLSQVERGLSTPTIRQLQLISSAMGVTIGWFFRDPTPRDDEDRVVVRAGRRKVLDMGGLGLTDELLVPNLDGQLELLLCTIQPGAGSADSYTHEGEEAAFILSGALELWVDEKLYVLGAGDSFALASTRPHRYRNPGPGITQVIWAITPPSF
ncbi:MAG: cupin domain-containing protein [Inquilinus sp.]|uniref:cupin domain-containing protein n=1 Tax=Inquilinus sp. TaxID=1932117 RepID=UPI003F3C5D8C